MSRGATAPHGRHAFMAAHPLRRPEWMRMARAGEMACWAVPFRQASFKKQEQIKGDKNARCAFCTRTSRYE